MKNRLVIADSLVTPAPDMVRLNTAKIEKNIAEIKKIWKAYMANHLTSEEKVLAAKFVDDRNKLVTQDLNPAIAALLTNKIKRTSRITVETIPSLYQPVEKSIQALVKLQLTVAKQEYKETQSRYEIIRNTSIATAIIGLGLALWLGYLLVRAISRLLEDAVHRKTQIQTILDSALDAVISMDIYGLVMYWNPQAEKIFGFSRAEAMGKLLSDLIIPPSVREAHNHKLKHFLKTGESSLLSKRIEVTAMRANGSEFPIELVIAPIRNGDVLFFNAFIRDITSRKQAEHELTRLGRVLDESSNDIYVFDAQTLHFTMVNAEAQRNLGYSMDELKGLTVLDVEPNLAHNIFEQRISPLRLGKQDVVIYETEHRRKDKEPLPHRGPFTFTSQGVSASICRYHPRHHRA